LAFAAERERHPGSTSWDHLVEVHDDRDIFQVSPDELPAIDIQSL